MNRIDIRFNELKNKKEKALIPFVTFGAGMSIDKTVNLIVEMDKNNATAVEIGVPFSDPLADGPVIQNAYTKALKDNIKLKDVFTAVKKVRLESDIPIIIMVYFNIVYCTGIERFLEEAKLARVDGLIVPDIPLEERKELNNLCNQNGIYLIPLVARTSRDRIAKITQDAKGFVYCVSTNGTTGEKMKLDPGTHEYLQEVKKNVDIPICIGFGISSKETVNEVKDYCDGVIVGSAVVKRMEKGTDTVIDFINDLHKAFDEF